MQLWEICLFTFLLTYVHLGEGDASPDSVSKKGVDVVGDEGSAGGGRFPEVFNLASGAAAVANATCGERGPELYCRPAAAAGAAAGAAAVTAEGCAECDAGSTDASRRHGADNAVDGSGLTWWQSPSLHAGRRYQWVTLTIDLKQMYQVTYVVVKAAISPRPANWILERSIDGSTYRPWQYYAQTDDECWTHYGVQPTRDKPSYKSDTEVICTSYYSKLDPIEGGEIHTSLVSGRPGGNSSSDEILDFTRARYVRLRLQKIRAPRGSQFEARASPAAQDAAAARRLFYSIKDVTVRGRCICSGHADKCTNNGIHGQPPRCECRHHTCGERCDECCPLYNQVPWREGTLQDAAPCEPCECHGKATACRYDPQVATLGQSQDSTGILRGGGVCLNCSAHTTGINCEQCEHGWYRPDDVSPHDFEPCRPCDCSNATSTGRCTFDSVNEANTGGVCECLAGFAGPRCDQCAPGFRDFPRCVRCPCDLRGMDLAGCEEGCTCKRHVEGDQCEACKPGFFDLDADNPDGCTPCYCSGVTQVCKEAHLYLHNTETLSGWLVSNSAVTRTVLPTVDVDGHQLVIGNDELPGVENYYWLAPEEYCGNLLSSYGTNLTYHVSWVVMRGDTSGKPNIAPNIILVGENGGRLGWGEKSYQEQNATISVPLREGGWYHLPHEGTRTDIHGSWVTRDQLMAVLADVKHLLLRAKFHTDQVEGSLWRAVQHRGVQGASGSATRHAERCLCPPGYAGLSCEQCQYGYARVGPSECRRCDCNGHSAGCDLISGQCGVCEHNTTGSKCEECLPGYHGDAERGTPSDCQPCACPFLDPSNNFSPTCERRDEAEGAYVCTACPLGFTGDHCELCANGFYGNPLMLGSSCRPCDCNGGPCDVVTGQCLECRGNTEGWKCERCRAGHYGDPLLTDCKPCQCSEEGSLDPHTCDAQTGQCTCLENFVGRTCNRCQEGYGNVTAGCVPCSCDPVGSSSVMCDPVTGECPCLSGVGGTNCGICRERHYGFSPSGCPVYEHLDAPNQVPASADEYMDVKKYPASPQESAPADEYT